jgi:hypothetical protein
VGVRGPKEDCKNITRKEGVMNLKKVFFVKLLVLILVLSFTGPAFTQGKPSKRVVRAGAIEWVSRDFKYIGINEGKVLITPQTKVLDEKGNSLDIRELRRGRHVVVELILNSSGSAEKRIIIKK